MERTYLQWNLPNFITVYLMAVIGYAVFSTVVSFVNNKLRGSAE